MRRALFLTAQTHWPLSSCGPSRHLSDSGRTPIYQLRLQVPSLIRALELRWAFRVVTNWQGAGSLYLSSINFETRTTSRLLPLAEGVSQKESQLWAFSSQPSWWLREWAAQSGTGSEWVHHTFQIPFYLHKMCAHPELEIIGSSSLFNIVLVFDSQSSNSDVQEMAYSYDLWCYLISIPNLHPARIYWKCNVSHAWGFLPKSGLFAGSRPRLEGGGWGRREE